MPTVLNVTTKVMTTGTTKMTVAFKGNPPKKNHKGVDLIPASTSETPNVIAFADGTVIQTQNVSGTNENTGNPGMGTSVGIKHADGKVTRYQHLKAGSLKVKKGDKVKKGQVLGVYGRPTTGNSTGPHLHFDISLPSKPSCDYVQGGFCGETRYYVDPVPYLTKPVSNSAAPKEPAAKTGKKYVVTASVLRVRIGPGLDYKQVGSVSRGATLTVLETKNGFARFGTDRWVSCDYIKEAK